jgi:hypothetical protein
MKPRKKRLTKQDLRAAGATPGLMVRRIGPDGRARLEQLAPEGPERRRDFIRRLRTDENAQASSEGSKTA